MIFELNGALDNWVHGRIFFLDLRLNPQIVSRIGSKIM